MKPVDPLTLESLGHHPAQKNARAAFAEAQRQCAAASEMVAAAERDLADAEASASDGNRDDKRLRAARERVTQANDEHRIAQRRVASAQAHSEETLRRVADEVHQHMVALHRAAVQELDAALGEAARRSHAVTALEDKSATLFSGGPYRTLPGRPLPRTSWRKEFGSPGSTAGNTRYGVWRECCGVFPEARRTRPVDNLKSTTPQPWWERT
jgi:hypothetical protein